MRLRPRRRVRVLEVGHEHVGAGIERVDDHLPIDGPGDFDAAVLKIRRNGADAPRPARISAVSGRKCGRSPAANRDVAPRRARAARRFAAGTWRRGLRRTRWRRASGRARRQRRGPRRRRARSADVRVMLARSVPAVPATCVSLVTMSRQSTTRQPVAMTVTLTRAITMKVMNALKAGIHRARINFVAA